MKWVLLVAGFGVFLLFGVGALMLYNAEQCRFPSNEVVEEFRYKIDLRKEAIRKRFQAGKVAQIVGPRIHTLFLDQEYGTYTVVADPSPGLSEIVFRVSNRSKDKYYLSRMTTLDAEDYKHNVTVGNVTKTENRANVFLRSDTTNLRGGGAGEGAADVGCRRADVTVTIPSACLLDETEFSVHVTKGHITTKQLTLASFEKITLENEMGEINGGGLQGQRVDLKTQTGTVKAESSAAHTMLLGAAMDGGVIEGRNITLFDGDDPDTCKPEVTYPAGFPKTPEYAQTKVSCTKVPGKLTVDARGAENGGNPAITLDRVRGGNVVSKVKVGHTKVTVMACYDTTANYTLQAPFGKISAGVDASALEGGGGRISNSQIFPFFNQTRGPAKGQVAGSICQGVSGFSDKRHSLVAESITTGNIELVVLPPVDPELMGSS